MLTVSFNENDFSITYTKDEEKHTIYYSDEEFYKLLEPLRGEFEEAKFYKEFLEN